MGSETSEQVMVFLKELALLKELEKVYKANPQQKRSPPLLHMPLSPASVSVIP